jgi:predicted nucleotidyltransferase
MDQTDDIDQTDHIDEINAMQTEWQKLTPDRRRRLREILRKLEAYRPEKVILLGSFARNESDDLSDIDLVVIKDTTEDFFARIRSVLNLLNLTKHIDVLVYTPAEFESMREQGNALIETVQEEGIVLYG